MEKKSNRPVLSLVIPVFNEALHLDDWCHALVSFPFGFAVEFVFVDDGSSDESLKILTGHASDPRVRVIAFDHNTGKGAALRAGISATRGDVVLIQDADYEYALADIAAVIAPILNNEADVVYGSRYKSSQTAHRPFHYLVNRTLTLLSNVASGLYLSDMETCYKAFRGEIVRNIRIESPRFGFEPEITAKVAALNVRVREVPIGYSPRSYLEGKKIRWPDGVAALWHIARFNLNRRLLAEAVVAVPSRFKRRA